jgi:ADP-heptose:LPS heptosyltransferase
MSLPAIRAVRERFPNAEITVLARPWVADLYSRETSISRVILYEAPSGFRGLGAKWAMAGRLGREQLITGTSRHMRARWPATENGLAGQSRTLYVL